MKVVSMPDRPSDPKHRLRLAALALLWERIWPALWPGVAVIGIFLAAALFDLPARLPGVVHIAALAVAAVALAAALRHAWPQFRLPGRGAARRRIETASGVPHRPLTALEDKLASGGADPAAQALFEVHRRRMAEAARRLRVGLPAAGLMRRDPIALRVALGLVLVIAVVDAGRDWPERLLRAVSPSFAAIAPAQKASLDIWVTPPDYTGLPPQFLPAAAPATPIAVPTGSTVLAQVHGGHAAPRLSIDDKQSDFARIDESNFKGSAVISAGSRLAVTQDGLTLGTWPISVVPDNPPTIAFAKPPEHSEHGALRLEYQASDDYGVESVKAVLRRADAPEGEPLVLDLPLPGQHRKEAHDQSYHDLTANLWAGLPVTIRLEASDALGQKAQSEAVTVTLPERVFRHPVARAIIEQRKELTLHPDDRQSVAEILSDLSLRPKLFNDDHVVFLALRTTQARLQLDRTGESIAPVQQTLWETALRIEDGRASQSQADLRQAMKALQDALARNAPEAEIERLMRELQQAMDRYLQALAENMRHQGDDGQRQPGDERSRRLSQQDLQNLLDRARNMARSGARDKARDMLSQLQEMLENLRTAQPSQQQSGQAQSMRQMQDMMRRQQQLLDRSFRRSRQGQQQPGDAQAGQEDAAQQDALRHQLGEMMRQLGEQQGGDVPQSLGRAERAMRDAIEALGHGRPGAAIDPQSQALDSLQQAARALAQQMSRNGERADGVTGEENDANDRDPFGRMNDDSSNGHVDDGGVMRMGKSQSDYALEKAREILDELRQRENDRSRPVLEHEYIDRLLKQF
jgi:uncharacterized protein (TIGR02302 family)